MKRFKLDRESEIKRIISGEKFDISFEDYDFNKGHKESEDYSSAFISTMKEMLDYMEKRINEEVGNKSKKIKKDVVKTLKNWKKFNKKENVLYNGNQQIDELLIVFDDDRFYQEKENQK